MTLTKIEQQKRATSVRNKQFGWEIVKFVILLTGETIDGVLTIIEAMGLADDVAGRSAIHKKYGKLMKMCRNPPNGRSVKRYKLRVHLVQMEVKYATITSNTLLLFGYEIRTKTIYYEEIPLAKFNHETQWINLDTFKTFLVNCQEKCGVKFEQVLLTQRIIDSSLDKGSEIANEDWMIEIESPKFGYTLVSFEWFYQKVFQPVSKITELEKEKLLARIDKLVITYTLANKSAQVALKPARNAARNAYAIPVETMTYVIESSLIDKHPNLKLFLSELKLKACQDVNQDDLNKLKVDVRHGYGDKAYQDFCKAFDVAEALFVLK